MNLGPDPWRLFVESLPNELRRLPRLPPPPKRPRPLPRITDSDWLAFGVDTTKAKCHVFRDERGER